MLKIAGLITALITPFDGSGEVMEDSLSRLVEFQRKAGVNGVFLCGTAGSGAVMRPSQKKRVFELAVKSAEGRIATIAHVGSTSTEETLDLATYAEGVGVDAIGCVPPYYFSPDETELIEHFRKLAEAVELPVYIYNIPRNTNTNVQPELMAKLCSIRNIEGVKDSSRDFIQILEYLRVLPRDKTVICGTDSYILPALIMGAKGVITGYANAFPEVYVEFYKLYLNGEMEKAKEYQFRINELRKALQKPQIAPHHEALRLRGIEAGNPRAPLRGMNEKERESLRRRLEELGFL